MKCHLNDVRIDKLLVITLQLVSQRICKNTSIVYSYVYRVADVSSSGGDQRDTGLKIKQ